MTYYLYIDPTGIWLSITIDESFFLLLRTKKIVRIAIKDTDYLDFIIICTVFTESLATEVETATKRFYKGNSFLKVYNSFYTFLFKAQI